jgi:peptidoglycan hydrolase-like protein with peptidoglycan-binding domain
MTHQLAGPSITPAILPTLKLGDRSMSVILLQQALRLVGQYWDAIDGIFDTETQRAVRLFQLSCGLPETGVVEYQTWKHLSMLMNAACPALIVAFH